MEKIKIRILIAIFLQVHFVTGFEPDICSDFLTNSRRGQLSPPNIVVEVPKIVKSSEIIAIKIKGLKNVSGLSLQAKTHDEISIGKFSSNIKANQTNCRGISTSSAIYRISPSDTETEVSWEAPSIKEAINFRFYVTIIQSSQDFYPPFVTDAITIETENDNELDLIYDGCGSQKVCFGIPDGCVLSKNCNLFTSANKHDDGNFHFELLSMPNHNYVAFGVSHSPIMANTSNIECIQETPTIITAYTSWMSPPRVVARSGVDQTIIRFLEGRLINGRIYCRILRDSFSIVNDHIIDLENEQYFLMLAGGIQLRQDSVGTHGINRGVSSEPISLVSIYDGCSSSKTCYGIPNGCISARNCDLLGAVTYGEGNFDFELLSMPNHNYIAFGVSQSPMMELTSNVECIQSSQGIMAYTSWINAGRQVSRVGVDQTTIELLESRFIDGRIYCKIRRDPSVTIDGNLIDLENDEHFLLLAGGTELRENSVGNHDENRGATDTRFLLTSPSPPTESPPGDSSIYEGCRTQKLCFGMPDGCISSRDCQLLSTTRRVNEDFFEFELQSNHQHNYIAFGISQTRSMAQASVFECVHFAGTISAFASWNYATTNNRLDVPQNFIRLREGRMVDGRIYCRVERNTQTAVRGESFNLETQMHYIQIAGGPVALPNHVGAHLTFRHISDTKVDLTLPGEIRGVGISALLMTHGSFMIVAWIGLTSIGIVFAKYFKPMWPNKKILGKDLWFVWHIACMTLTWILTMVGFIIIFVDLGTWRTTTHSILGCIVFTLASLQAIGGIMRPGPKDEHRPIFNWIHQALGNVTHLLAILCIFYAIQLPSARLPDYFIYVLIGAVSFYFLIHFFFMIIDVKGNIKKSKVEKQIQEVIKNPYSVLKIFVLAIHVMIILLFVIGLILVFTLEL